MNQAAPVSFVDVDTFLEGDADAASLPGAMNDTLGELVDAIVATDRMLATVSAWRAELVDQARQWSELGAAARPGSRVGGWDAATIARRELVTEIAAALRLPERTTEALIDDSQSLIQDLPETTQALRDGDVSCRHAQSIADHARSLPVDARAAFETQVLPYARNLTVARFDRKARVVREASHPQTIAERKAKGVSERSVGITPGRDGMAWLSAHLPAEVAYAIDDRLTSIARGLRSADDPRTIAQLRSDAFADLLVSGEAGCELGHGIRARVLVTVPVLSLLGSSQEPASLEGYGPIDAATARELAAHAPSFTRILTHPETGTVLSVGRDRYAVPHDLKDWLRVRDETCRHPGCGRLAAHCDIDHTVDWQHHGSTRHDNLAHLCEKHHHTKHYTRWAVRHLEKGVFEWRSPAGKIYLTEPANDLPV